MALAFGKNIHSTSCVGWRNIALLCGGYLTALFSLSLILAAIFPYYHLYLPMLTKKYLLNGNSAVSIFYLVYCYVIILFTSFMVLYNFFKSVFTSPGYVPHDIWRHEPVILGRDGRPLRTLPEGGAQRTGHDNPKPPRLSLLPQLYGRHSLKSLLPRKEMKMKEEAVVEMDDLPDKNREDELNAESLDDNTIAQFNQNNQSSSQQGGAAMDGDNSVLEKEETPEKVADQAAEDAVVLSDRCNPYPVYLLSRNCIRFCSHCDQYKPDRAYHCHDCERCVFHMDHHCPFINNCVGRDNTKYFLLFTLYIPIGATHILLTMLYSLLFRSSSHLDFEVSTDSMQANRIIYYFTAMICISFCIIFFGCFSAHFWELIWRGESSITQMIAYRTGTSAAAVAGLTKPTMCTAVPCQDCFGRPPPHVEPSDVVSPQSNRFSIPQMPREMHEASYQALDQYFEAIMGCDRRWWVVMLPIPPKRTGRTLMDGTPP